jgi:hypothetical protein
MRFLWQVKKHEGNLFESSIMRTMLITPSESWNDEKSIDGNQRYIQKEKY